MDPARLHAPAARDILAVLQVATWRAVPFIVLAQWRVSGDGEQFAVTLVVQVNCGAPSTCLLLAAHCRLRHPVDSGCRSTGGSPSDCHRPSTWPPPSPAPAAWSGRDPLCSRVHSRCNFPVADQLRGALPAQLCPLCSCSFSSKSAGLQPTAMPVAPWPSTRATANCGSASQSERRRRRPRRLL